MKAQQLLQLKQWVKESSPPSLLSYRLPSILFASTCQFLLKELISTQESCSLSSSSIFSGEQFFFLTHISDLLCIPFKTSCASCNDV